jgi:hypothetical protein
MLEVMLRSFGDVVVVDAVAEALQDVDGVAVGFVVQIAFVVATLAALGTADPFLSPLQC